MLGGSGATVLASHHITNLNQTPPISSDDVNFQGTADECAGTPAGSVVWHFVLTKTSASSANLVVTFANAGGPTSYPSDFKSGGTLHWFITTGAPDTLLAAFAEAVGNNLNLSHICNGGTTTTTTSSSSTTTSSSSSTTSSSTSSGT